MIRYRDTSPKLETNQRECPYQNTQAWSFGGGDILLAIIPRRIRFSPSNATTFSWRALYLAENSFVTLRASIAFLGRSMVGVESMSSYTGWERVFWTLITPTEILILDLLNSTNMSPRWGKGAYSSSSSSLMTSFVGSLRLAAISSFVVHP